MMFIKLTDRKGNKFLANLDKVYTVHVMKEETVVLFTDNEHSVIKETVDEVQAIIEAALHTPF